MEIRFCSECDHSSGVGAKFELLESALNEWAHRPDLAHRDTQFHLTNAWGENKEQAFISAYRAVATDS